VITHPDKVLFPDDGITKGELASFYDAIAPVMLPHVRARPITMERYPSGINKPGFMHKDVAKGFPEWLERVEVPKRDGTVRHALVTDSRSLLWLANQNCITPHLWTSRVPKLYQPDLCVFDLDPSGDNAGAVRAAALQVRDLLGDLGLASWVKTSGSKGSTSDDGQPHRRRRRPLGRHEQELAATSDGATPRPRPQLGVGDLVRPALWPRPQRVRLVVVLEVLSHGIPVELPLQLHGRVVQQAGRAGAVSDLDRGNGLLA